jgi:hypothetical protein
MQTVGCNNSLHRRPKYFNQKSFRKYGSFMKKFLFALFCFSSLLSEAQENSNAIKNTQQRNSSSFINYLEKGDTSNAFKLLDNSYYLKKKTNLSKLYQSFISDFKSLPPNTKRYVTLVFPSGYHLFRYRYIDDSGIILQLDISYKETEINSRILTLGLINTGSFKKVAIENKIPKYDFE